LRWLACRGHQTSGSCRFRTSGSVAEVVDDGVTGFVVDGEAEAVQAIRRLGELDRRQIRAHFEQRFTATRMAEEYLSHYAMLAGLEPKSLGRSLDPTIALQE